MKKQTHEVFGISPTILADSYVDRGNLDKEISRKLRRPIHLALRGESKCGKSWLRQKNIPNAIVVQCRLKTTVLDIYIDILSQLGISLVLERTEKDTIKGVMEGSAAGGIGLIAKLKVKFGFETSEEEVIKKGNVGQDINDLRFIAEIINEAGRKVVIEDFHYLNTRERQIFAYDLKALWDYGCFFVIIGVWTKTNLLIYLNSDLGSRIEEIPISWSRADLEQVIISGSETLKVKFSDHIKRCILDDCYGNVGILQQLALNILDETGIDEECTTLTMLDDQEKFVDAAMKYAEQLNSRYQKFAKDISSGIRKRTETTGIYAHAMAVIMDSSDKELIQGLELDTIFKIASRRQSRILKGNLRTVLQKIEELQVDSDDRGLVLSYNDATDEVTAIDRTILIYRKYVTIKWPWEDLINEAKDSYGEQSRIFTN
ncbi:hypothetical protein P2V34_000109 [Escherichia coli]|uniref:hypothetical protein n=1 Tax=Escherichia coli TaxID=562 RepID=UPI000BE4D822|nr:hypothetical protein [Escherichia coli]EIU6247885.1 hypothetical protein [Escherichia coli]EJT7948414.1 hypothetical protein [Escherichia coli]EJU0503911.1 hypothetical protein [Escherichia coli]EJV1905411.1 hypothetical protein [Escherichia coli]EJV1994171.1 hypothetical protein [Escherichia coli]